MVRYLQNFVNWCDKILKCFQNKETATLFFDNAMRQMYGHMLEECIIYDVQNYVHEKELNFDVYKAIFDYGEFDMCVEDLNNNRCAIYEIKHRGSIHFESQTKNILDVEKIKLFNKNIYSKNIIYLGEDIKINDVNFINAEQFLINLNCDNFDLILGEQISNNDIKIFHKNKNSVSGVLYENT